MTPLPVSDGKTVRLPLPSGPLPHASPDIVPPLTVPVVVEPDDALVALVDTARGVLRCWTQDAPVGFAMLVLARALAAYDNTQEETDGNP